MKAHGLQDLTSNLEGFLRNQLARGRSRLTTTIYITSFLLPLRRNFGFGGVLVLYWFGTGGEPVRNWVDVFRLLWALPLRKVFDDAVSLPIRIELYDLLIL